MALVPVLVSVALILMSLSALRVKMLLDQLMAESTVILPSSVPVLLVSPAHIAPSSVDTVTLPDANAVSIAVALLSSMVILTGSINHSPPLVLTVKFSLMFKVAAEVSTKLASNVPSALISPFAISASK